MPLRWQTEHCGPGAIAFDGNLLVGQVAKYAITEPGRTDVLGWFYVGFRSGDRVTERCDSLEEAQRGVERQWRR